MRARHLSCAFVLYLGGCLPGPATDDGDETAGSSEEETSAAGTSTTGYVEPQPCEATSDCEAGVCVAPYDPGGKNPIGEPKCVSSCVQPGDSTRYCIDDGSCCEGLSCDPQGFCDETTAESGTGDTDEETSGDETDGTTDESTT